MKWSPHFRWSVLVSMTAVSIGLLGCKPRNVMVIPPPPLVSVAKPTQEPVLEYVEFSGNTRAIDTVHLRSRVNGYLKEIHFEEGAFVKKGDLLFVIEPDQYEVALQAAKAALQKARIRWPWLTPNWLEASNWRSRTRWRSRSWMSKSRNEPLPTPT